MSDIVYCVKESEDNEELRYSLRSIHNFPHDKVWIYGYCPSWCKPDYYVHVEQDQDNKWHNVGKLLHLIMENNKISKNFWLFNDDFFIMEKVDKPINYHNGDLYKRIVTLEDYYKRSTGYSIALRQCAKEVEAISDTSRNYELHIPMLVNRAKARELHTIANSYGFRSLYGNYCNIKSKEMRDVKINNLTDRYIKGVYLSTSDNSFKYGVVGKQIRKMFPDKCQYEVRSIHRAVK